MRAFRLLRRNLCGEKVGVIIALLAVARTEVRIDRGRYRELPTIAYAGGYTLYGVQERVRAGLERIPVTFEHSLRAEKSYCILVGETR